MEPINITKVKKNKSKKNKSCENHDKQNINMKKSFSKFDDLQKRSLIHVRSRDCNKAKEIFHTPMAEHQLDNCHKCQKSVYKMEEVILQLKTGTKIFHKTCLRCKDCSKQLKSDSYHAHDGFFYCHMHFKLIFAPKIVYEETKPRKPELIIRENQPMELPPDVARASDKPNLGLDELQQLNVRSRFEVFENSGCKQNNNHSQETRQEIAITHGKSIRSTLTKLHKHGISNSISESFDGIINIDESDDSSNNANDDSDDFSRILTEKERPLGLGEAINDIRTKFENGEMITKEERREERKQEIQGIRSRLFMGKQAKIKEMYQQAVADSEQGVTSVGKNQVIELTTATRSIKDRFENGEAFKTSKKMQSNEATEDAEVFESAISKASRNIFMQLDANSASDLISSRSTMPNNLTENRIQNNKKNADTDIIKSDSKAEYIKVATEELSERFKFFEQFRPVENKKHAFRITPPREGVVRLDSDTDMDISSFSKQTSLAEDNILQKTKTTSTILNKFREMEKNKTSDENEKMKKPKPLKCFTPPPENEINKHFYNNNNSDAEDEESSSEDGETNTNEGSDDEEEMEDENVSKSYGKDQALQEAKNAARAKQLRAKFEKWQINEIQREIKEDREDVYSQLISSDSIESAKAIRERFENMKKVGETQIGNNIPRAQINRFV